SEVVAVMWYKSDFESIFEQLSHLLNIDRIKKVQIGRLHITRNDMASPSRRYLANGGFRGRSCPAGALLQYRNGFLPADFSAAASNQVRFGKGDVACVCLRWRRDAPSLRRSAF